MAPSISSKSLKASTELTVIAKIKSGLVEIPDPMSYTTRLERLLDVLFTQRKGSVETGQSGFVGPLETLRSLHFVHWAIIDSGTRLLLTVAFDKPFEPYIRSIVDDAGPLLDVIFFHCEGYESSTTRHGYLAFAEWVRARQQTTNFFFADFPELSVDDIRYLQKLKSLHDDPSKTASDAFALDARVSAPARSNNVARLLKTVLGLYRLKAYYPESGDVRQANGGDAAYSDRAIFNRSVKLIAQGYSASELREDNVPQEILVAYNDFKTWYHAVLASNETSSVKAELPADTEIQGNIRTGYDKMSDGCVVLVKFKDAKTLLAYLTPRVTTEAGAADDAVKCNVSFAYNGLTALGLSQAELDSLPNEFREGMEARAGLLGDVGSNHPEQWSLPSRNWPEPTAAGARAALASVDAVVVFQTRRTDVDTEATLQLLRVEIDQLAKQGAQILHVQALQRHDSRWQNGFYREHFGYADGISQPKPVAELKLSDLSATTNLPYENTVSAGEVFVGLANDHGDVPPAATQGDLLKNGTFLVMRKLAQNVDAFNAFVESASSGKDKDVVKGLLLGRKPDGTPLVSAAPGPDRNTFDYEAEADKAGNGGCPFQAHVRLANPRFPTTATVHGKPKRTPRIVRRGFSYGPPRTNDQLAAEAQAERGIVFMAYVANIAEQYEVIQRWLNGGNSTGLHSSQNDPITGPGGPPTPPPAPSSLSESPPPGSAPFRFTENDGGSAQEKKLPAIPTPFVKLEWGLYLFTPSLRGLQRLSQAAEKPASSLASTLAIGGVLLQGLLAKDDPLEWKKILEGQGEREKAFAVWAAIRERGGVLKTKYGILVGREDYTLEVLKDETRFSAREYWLRMKGSSIPMHLGMDAAPLNKAVCPMRQGARPDQTYVDDVNAGVVNYERESIANPFLASISRADAFRAAYLTTIAVMSRGALAGPRQLADMYVVGERVIAGLSQLWFGIPDGTHMQQGGQMDSDADTNAYCPSDFTFAAQSIFRPNPDTWTIDLAKRRGAAVTQAAAAYVQGQLELSTDMPPFIQFLLERATKVNPGDRDGQMVRSLVGAVDGFVAANWGGFVTIISMWVKSQDLWQVQTRYESEIQSLAETARSQNGDLASMLTPPASSPLISRIFDSLRTLPVPSWLHRTAIQRTVLGSVQVEPGDRVVLNLSSAALDRKTNNVLFGGVYSETDKGPGPLQTPRHACPAQEMAIGVLAGMLVAVLERKAIRAESPLALSFVPLPKPQAAL
jgi:Dyp-type peroxidase family